jgi:hypothetical protein
MLQLRSIYRRPRIQHWSLSHCAPSLPAVRASSMASYAPNATQNRQISIAFDILNSQNESSARRGVLSVPGRLSVQTPHYTAITSRGSVPHLSQDTLRDQTSINGVYVALEDCKSKRERLCVVLCEV